MPPESECSGILLSLEVLTISDMTPDIGVDDAGVYLRNVVFLGVGNAGEDIAGEDISGADLPGVEICSRTSFSADCWGYYWSFISITNVDR